MSAYVFKCGKYAVAACVFWKIARWGYTLKKKPMNACLRPSAFIVFL